MKPVRWFVIACMLYPITGIRAQDLDVMHVGWGSVDFQVSSDTLLPAGEVLEMQGSWIFSAGVQFESGTVQGLRLAGPPFPGGVDVPFFEDSTNEFELEVGFDSKGALLETVSPGTYTFSGTGTSIGLFSEDITVGEVQLLSPKKIINWQDLQSVDPAQPVVIEWEPFLDHGDKPAFIEVEVFQETRFGEHTYWSTEGLEGDGFGLPVDTTSVEIPAGTLTGDPREPYEIWVFFGRIEQMEEGSVFGSGMTGAVATHETIFHLHAAYPGHINLPYKAWMEDEVLGWIYGLTEDWGYSLAMGNIWVGNTPGWVYQTKLGWMYAVSGTMKEGCWLYSLVEGWIFTRADWNGWYNTPEDTWGSLVDP